MARHNQINQLSGEAAELQKNAAQQTMSRPSAPTVIQNKQRGAERAGKDLASGINKHGRFSGERSEKNESLNSFRRKHPDEDEALRKTWARLEEEWVRSHAEYRKQVDEMIRRGAEAPIILGPGVRESEAYDFFLSYASEDREGLVRELAHLLRAKGAGVWYDEFVLKVGDSLRQKIEHGLANSLYGIVVLSEYFFVKEWPRKELESLISLEADGEHRIFPVWHKISRDEVARYSPLLLDRVGLRTFENTVEEIAEKVLEAKKQRQARQVVESKQAPV